MIMGYSDKISMSTGDQNISLITIQLHTIILVTRLIIAICNVYDSQIFVSECVFWGTYWVRNPKPHASHVPMG